MVTGLRWVAAAVLLLLGAATALAAVVAHATWWGLPLAVAAVVATLVAVGPGWLTRLPYAVGFAAVLLCAIPPRPEGDYVVSSDGRGYLLLGLGLAVVVASVATLPRPGRRPAPAPGGGALDPTTYHGARD